MTDHLPAPAPVEIAVVTGLTEGVKLRDCRRVTLTPTQAIFDSNMSQDQWIEFGRWLRQVKTASRYYEADWLNKGKKEWGGSFVESTVQQLCFDLDDIVLSSQVALLPVASRIPELTSAHYEQLGFLVDTEKMPIADMDKWVLIAKQESLTPGELYNSVIAGQVTKRSRADEVGHSNRDGFQSIHGINTRFTRWLKTVPVEKMAIEQKREILVELKPMVELAAKLQAEVGA